MPPTPKNEPKTAPAAAPAPQKEATVPLSEHLTKTDKLWRRVGELTAERAYLWQALAHAEAYASTAPAEFGMAQLRRMLTEALVGFKPALDVRPMPTAEQPKDGDK